MIRIPEYLEKRRLAAARRPPAPSTRRRSGGHGLAGGRAPMSGAATRRLRVLLAPDSFKGSLTSVEVARALAAGWSRARPGDELILAPLADGGEGTLAAIAESGGWEWQECPAHDPLGRPLTARWLRSLDGERARRGAGRGVGAVAPARRRAARRRSRPRPRGRARSCGRSSTRAFGTWSWASAAAPPRTAARGCCVRWGSGIAAAPRSHSPGRSPIWRPSTLRAWTRAWRSWSCASPATSPIHSSASRERPPSTPSQKGAWPEDIVEPGSLAHPLRRPARGRRRRARRATDPAPAPPAGPASG